MKLLQNLYFFHCFHTCRKFFFYGFWAKSRIHGSIPKLKGGSTKPSNVPHPMADGGGMMVWCYPVLFLKEIICLTLDLIRGTSFKKFLLCHISHVLVLVDYSREGSPSYKISVWFSGVSKT